MKKYLMILSLLFATTIAFAIDYSCFEEKCYFTDSDNYLYPSSFQIYYSVELECYYISQEDGGIIISDETIRQIRAAYEKYVEWEEIAVKNKVTIEKKIPVTATAVVFWLGAHGDAGMSALELKFYIFSQSTSKHQFIISADKAYDFLGDGSLYFEMKEIYLNKDQAEKLYNDLSSDSLKKQQEIIKKKIEVDSLFN